MSATRLYACRSGGETVPSVVVDPFGVSTPTVNIPWFFYVIMHDTGVTLFDAGIHPELVTDAHSRVGDWADHMQMHAQPADSVVAQLAAIGVRPDDVHTIVLSHLHFDHASGLPLFPHAEIVVQRAELGFAEHPPTYQAGPYNPLDWAHGPRWREVTGFVDVHGDGALTTIPLPGHTPGHQGLLVRLPGSCVLLVADAVYRMDMLRERRLAGVLWEPDAVMASMDLIEYLESREQATILCSHEDPAVSGVRIAPDDWYE